MGNIRSIWDLSIAPLGNREKRRLYLSLVVQLSLAVFDLVGVVLSGVLAYLAVQAMKGSGLQANQLGMFTKLVSHLGVFSRSLYLLTGLIVSLIILKNFLSLLATKKLYKDLVRRSDKFSEECIDATLKMPWLWIRSVAPEEITYALTEGINALTIGVVGNVILALSECFMLFTLVLVLGVVDKVMVAFAIVFFGVIAILMNRILGARVRGLGQRLSDETLSGRAVLGDVKGIYREIGLQRKEDFFRRRYMDSRRSAADAYAKADVTQQLPKYLLEMAAILGMGLLFFISQLTSNPSAALQKSFIFFVASSRIVPSLLRLQSYWLGLHRSIGYSTLAIAIIGKILDPNFQESPMKKGGEEITASSTPVALSIESVNFQYPDSEKLVLSEINWEILPFETVALVGSSGSGKSTLCDLVAGTLLPTSGSIKIFGLEPRIFNQDPKNSIVYLPQGSDLIRGTILENICLITKPSHRDIEDAIQALKNAALLDFVESLPGGIDTPVGENGVKLSGGQKQRLVLARTIFAKPDLVILDEPTSSLDFDTSQLFEEYLHSLKDTCTVIVVTHKAPNPELFDKVFHIQKGKLLLRD